MRSPQRRPAMLPPLLAAVCFLGGMALSGCEPADARGLVRVAGRITLDGGNWPKPGTLTFVPAEEQPAEGGAAGPPPPTRVGFAEFDVEGRFVAQTRRPGDGLMPGRYRVGVSCWLQPPDMASPGSGPAAPEAVRDPKKSSLYADIPAAGEATLSLNVRR